MNNKNVENGIEIYKQLVRGRFSEKDGNLISSKLISSVIAAVAQSVNINNQTFRKILKVNGLAVRTSKGVFYKNLNCPIYDAKEQVYLSPIELAAQEYGYPPALAKACCDYFENALKLRTGEVIFYTKAEPINKDWIFIDGIDDQTLSLQNKSSGLPDVGFHRGMEIKISEIIWCADAPNGS
jgi:hypothetical protein